MRSSSAFAAGDRINFLRCCRQECSQSQSMRQQILNETQHCIDVTKNIQVRLSNYSKQAPVLIALFCHWEIVCSTNTQIYTSNKVKNCPVLNQYDSAKPQSM